MVDAPCPAVVLTVFIVGVKLKKGAANIARQIERERRHINPHWPQQKQHEGNKASADAGGHAALPALISARPAQVAVNNQQQQLLSFILCLYLPRSLCFAPITPTFRWAHFLI